MSGGSYSGHKRKESSEEKQTTIMEVLTCMICFSTMRKEIVSCPLGHSFCLQCFKKMLRKICPTCRTPMPPEPARNLLAENMSGIFEHLCKNASCKFASKSEELDIHERICFFNPIKCPIPSCDWESKGDGGGGIHQSSELLDHLRDEDVKHKVRMDSESSTHAVFGKGKSVKFGFSVLRGGVEVGKRCFSWLINFDSKDFVVTASLDRGCINFAGLCIGPESKIEEHDKALKEDHKIRRDDQLMNSSDYMICIEIKDSVNPDYGATYRGDLRFTREVSMDDLFKQGGSFKMVKEQTIRMCNEEEDPYGDHGRNDRHVVRGEISVYRDSYSR